MCHTNESQAADLRGERLLANHQREESGRIKRLARRVAWRILGFACWREVTEELLLLGKITCPIVITSLLLFSKSIISVYFLGHLGDSQLAGGSLSIGFANITGYSVLKGLAIGMEPICGQAFGAKHWVVLSQAFQKTLLLLLIATLPIALLWLNIEPIMLLLGQDPDITTVARVHLVFSIPELLAQAFLHPLRIFLRAQNLTKPLMLSASVAFMLHFSINHMLVVKMGLGIKGVALATAWNTVNLNIGLLVYIAKSNISIKPWDGAMGRWRKGWKPLLKLAMPSALSVCLEWWWYEFITIMCGLLKEPRTSVAAMGILIQTTGLMYVVPSSLGMGLSTRVGNELGAGQPERASWAATCGLGLAAFCGFTAFGFTAAARNAWGSLFTNEPQILALTSMALPIVGFCEIGNCPQTAGCGILTGSARPSKGVQINLKAFYVVGLPVAAGLGFGLNVGFLGLWLGLVAAQASCVLMMVKAVLNTDWDTQAQRARALASQAAAFEELDEEGDVEATTPLLN